MNHAELDRRLCERLGIAPSLAARHEYHDHAGNPCDCTCGARYADSRPRGEKCPARCDYYPALSTTGEGMLALMEALRFYGYYSQVVARDRGFTARIGASVSAGNVGHHVQAEGSGPSAPLALALAAASALGIEAPE